MFSNYQKTKLQQIDQLIQQLKKQNSKETKYFTFTCKTTSIHPLLFFQANEQLFKNKRFFWKSKHHETFFVGLGEAWHTKQIEKWDVLQLKEYWNELRTQLIQSDVRDEFPLLFGGMSFEEYGEYEEEWVDFGHASFVMPSILYAWKKGVTTITITEEVTAQTSLEAIEARWENWHWMWEEEKTIQSSRTKPPIVEEQETSLEEWRRWVASVRTAIQHGEVEKVVLARQKRLTFLHPLCSNEVLESLYRMQTNSYLFVFERGDSYFIGASPEQLIEKQGNKWSTMALAGSVKRGLSLKEDEAYAQYLLNDEKNLWEHRLVVESIVEILRAYEVNVQYEDKPTIMKINDIQHLYTPISGMSDGDTTLIEMVVGLHPTPALGGFPRREALEKISELENFQRGFYAAPLGYWSLNGDGEFLVSIRSAVVKGEHAYLYAGCGLVQNSDVLSEYDETETKFKPMKRAFGEERRNA